MRVICTDTLDKDGNLLRVEVHDEAGEFLLQFLWDERDAQTSEKRAEFRKWVSRHLKQVDYEEIK